MFENVLGQSAASQLKEDITAGLLTQAMLFSGPAACGKGTCALELARVISCENDSSWSCACPACVRHKLLIHPDLLCLGWRPFSAEISACAGAFLRDQSTATRTLFIRSIRKLLARFNPVLWEDDPKRTKLFPMVVSIEEELDELGLTSPESAGDYASLVEEIKKNAFKLESEGVSENIPIDHIRRANAWGHLAPTGKARLLLIENADRMQEEARNSLLKLLEEPPARLYCVITSSRAGSLLPTILSRLRPYHFISRDSSVEAEVIRRVFKDQIVLEDTELPAGKTRLETYLDSFLPVSGAVLSELAAFFAASIAYKAAILSKKHGRQIPEEVVRLGQYNAPIAEAAGLGRPNPEAGAAVELILNKAEKFAIRSLFSRFLMSLSDHASMRFQAAQDSYLPRPDYYEMWKKSLSWANEAAGTYNLRPVQVLEKLFIRLSREMAEL